MLPIAEALKFYTHNHPFDSGNGESETVLDQLYQAYAESHESDPPEISNGFKELECFLETLPLNDNNAVFNLCCRLCTAYEEKAFHDGLLSVHTCYRSYSQMRMPKNHPIPIFGKKPFL